MLALIESTPPRVAPSRKNAVSAAAKSAGLFTADCLTSTMLMAAPGATACTISASSTSSPPASQGEAEPARLFTTRSRAGARPNRLSNRAMSRRMSLASGAGCWASSGITTVCPRPSMPRSSSGEMP